MGNGNRSAVRHDIVEALPPAAIFLDARHDLPLRAESGKRITPRETGRIARFYFQFAVGRELSKLPHLDR